MKLTNLLEIETPWLDLQTKLVELDIADGWDIELTKKGIRATKGKHQIIQNGFKLECVAYKYKQRCANEEHVFEVIEAMIGLCELAGAVDHLISAMVLDENIEKPMFEAERNGQGFYALYYGEWHLDTTDDSAHFVTASLTAAADWVRNHTTE